MYPFLGPRIIKTSKGDGEMRRLLYVEHIVAPLSGLLPLPW